MRCCERFTILSELGWLNYTFVLQVFLLSCSSLRVVRDDFSAPFKKKGRCVRGVVKHRARSVTYFLVLFLQG
jgi:hypothetical protein